MASRLVALAPPSPSASLVRASRASRASRSLLALAVTAIASVCASACTRVDEPQKAATKEPEKGAAVTAPKKLGWTRAPAGDLATVVLAHEKKAKAEGRVPLVYVGATWCEPCQHFHHAAERGDLDAAFGDVAVLELDADADKDRLSSANYMSTYIPLFVVPGPDGRGTERRMAGSIKGPGAVAEITPRLKKLLDR